MTAWSTEAQRDLGFKPAAHHRYLISKLEAVARGEIDRLMILMPPGSAKSTYASVLFPPWWFTQHPKTAIIGASHTSDLAESFGRRVRDTIKANAETLGYGLSASSSAAARWDTSQGGTYFAAGVGQKVTGRRADCVTGDTLVMTKVGPRRLDDIGIGASAPYILSYDESQSRTVFARVVAISRRKTDSLWRIRTASGRVVDATGNHRFYLQGGWCPASSLVVGDILLQALPKAAAGDGLQSGEEASEKSQSVLQPVVQHTIGECGEGRQRIRDLQEMRGEKIGQEFLFLFDGMSGCSAGQEWTDAPQGAGATLCDLWKELQSKNFDAAEADLLPQMRGDYASRTHEGRSKSRMAQWRDENTGTACCSGGIQSDEQSGSAPRRNEVRGVQCDGTPTGPSYRSEPCEQRDGKSRDFVRAMPSGMASGGEIQVTHDTVAVVEKIRRECWVYDIQVEGTSCFFANGILVHNCVIIDDPVASQDEADSAAVRESTWNWYRSDLYTRLKPGGRIILIMTRWHEDDLGGRLLKESASGGDKWHVIELPALARENDPLGRSPGEPLWPEWEDAKAIQRKRRAVGERAFSALFQQRPTTVDGAIIKRDWWRPWTDPVPRHPDMIFLSLDTAYSEQAQSDYSACTTWYVTTDETFRSTMLLRHAWAERLPFPELVDLLLETAREFGKPNVPMRVLIEAKASGISVIQELRRRAPDLPVFSVVPKHDKVSRAHAVTPMMEAGRVYALAKSVADDGTIEWRERAQMVINECASFPLGAHDDLTDTVTQLLRHVRDLGFEFHPEDEPEPARAEERAGLY